VIGFGAREGERETYGLDTNSQSRTNEERKQTKEKETWEASSNSSV